MDGIHGISGSCVQTYHPESPSPDPHPGHHPGSPSRSPSRSSSRIAIPDRHPRSVILVHHRPTIITNFVILRPVALNPVASAKCPQAEGSKA
jgi:hypothetical protein